MGRRFTTHTHYLAPLVPLYRFGTFDVIERSIFDRTGSRHGKHAKPCAKVCSVAPPTARHLATCQAHPMPKEKILKELFVSPSNPSHASPHTVNTQNVHFSPRSFVWFLGLWGRAWARDPPPAGHAWARGVPSLTAVEHSFSRSFKFVGHLIG